MDIQSNDKGLIYKWIRIQKQNESIADFHQQQVFNRYGDKSLRALNENEMGISVLTFQSMESLADKQVRVFAEGILEWNANEALFNGEKLVPSDAQLVDSNWMEVVAGFLGKHFKRTT